MNLLLKSLYNARAAFLQSFSGFSSIFHLTYLFTLQTKIKHILSSLYDQVDNAEQAELLKGLEETGNFDFWSEIIIGR